MSFQCEHISMPLLMNATQADRQPHGAAGSQLNGLLFSL